MYNAIQDELLLGTPDIVFRNCPTTCLVPSEAATVAECVHQPRLAESLGPNAVERLGKKALTCFRRVLLQQPADFHFREVAQPQGARADIEHAAYPDVCGL